MTLPKLDQNMVQRQHNSTGALAPSNQNSQTRISPKPPKSGIVIVETVAYLLPTTGAKSGSSNIVDRRSSRRRIFEA